MAADLAPLCVKLCILCPSTDVIPAGHDNGNSYVQTLGHDGVLKYGLGQLDYVLAVESDS